MIKDKLKNAETYYALSDRLIVGFEWLKNTNLDSLEDGKYEILGQDVYANVQTYETKDSAPYESHRKYIDIQYMINGKEIICVTDYTNCSVKDIYDEDRDIEFLNYDNNEEQHILNNGEFIVLFPQDAHQPSISYNEKATVKKVVVKVLI